MNRINGFHLYQAVMAGYSSMEENRERMNRINVFPVSDGDTGSNMVGTVRTIASGLETCRSAGTLLERMADLSLEGARGNSGMILSQYVNGLARLGRGKRELSLCDLGEILGRSVEEAYRAVESPREGTILTVMKAWAEKIRSGCSSHRSLFPVLKEALEAARTALERTPEQLEVLSRHGVVDAGALGFVSFLEGVDRLGETGRIGWEERARVRTGESLSPISSPSDDLHGNGESPAFRYCTEVLLENPSLDRSGLRDLLSPLGDSLIVTEGVNRSRIHIHSDRPDRVVDLLRSRGKVLQQKADDMERQEQIVSRRAGRIAVMTDSIADIPSELLDKYQIHLIPLALVWDGEEYLDRITLKPETFYRLQGERSSFPSSSLPTAAQVERQYSYLLEHYEGIIVLSVSSQLSGTWKRMSLSAEKFNQRERRISVVDTRLNSVAQGLLVRKIARAAMEGKGLEELTALAESLRERVHIFVSVKTFEFMIKGGRVSPLKGALAGLLRLKPVVTLDDKGRGAAFGAAFTPAGLMRKVSRIVADMGNGKGIEEYALVHAADRERGERFSALIEGITGFAPSYITDISSIVGMHSGKGAVAIGIVEKEG